MLEKIRHLGILHYHWLTGGVRTVVTNSLYALISHSHYQRIVIDLISSDAEQPAGTSLIEQCRKWAESRNDREIILRTVEISELAYNDQPSTSRAAFLHDARRICDQILAALPLSECSCPSPYVLHCHNLNLGKNPSLTAAIKLLAQRAEKENLPLGIIHQMHDFAEDNRPACWNALKNCTGSDDPAFAADIMYPCSSRIIWACINSRDCQRLCGIGLPKERIHFVPNAIDTEAFTSPPVTTMSSEQLKSQGLESLDYASLLRQKLTAYAQEHNFTYDPQRHLLLAPFKAIRRKNISELVLLLLHANTSNDIHQLVITLKPISQDDIQACAQLEHLVKQYRLPAVIGFGETLGGHSRDIRDGRVETFSLTDLIGLSSAVLTTSVQEGFGYVFHEPWLAGKPLLGRNIPEITSDFVKSGLQISHLYDRLLIPLTWLTDEELKNLQREYYHKQQRFAAASNIEPPSRQLFIQTFEKTKIHPPTEKSTESGIDWADLSFELQLIILEKVIQNPSLLKHVVFLRCHPHQPCDWQNRPNAATIDANRRVVMNKYGLARHAQQLTRLYNLMGSLDISDAALSSRIDNQQLLINALQLERMHLLV